MTTRKQPGLLRQWRDALRRWRLARRSPQDVFARYYHRNKWGDAESRSGKGSNMHSTEQVRAVLPGLLQELGAQSLLDLPCGDFNWMRHVDLGAVKYTGGDIVAEMIARNQAQFGRPDRQFEVINLITGPVPRHDVILTRDCLVHLSNAHVHAALANIRASGSTYLLSTINPESGQNEDIVTGQWRALDLTRAPFNLPPPLRLIKETYSGAKGQQPDKMLGLWRIQDLPG